MVLPEANNVTNALFAQNNFREETGLIL